MNINIHTPQFHIRSVAEADKDLFMSLRKEASDFAPAYIAFPDFEDFSWNQILSNRDEHSMIVFRESDGKFIATCSFQYIHSDPIEIGLDVVSSHRNQGIGTELLKDLAALAHELFPDRQVIARMEKDNLPSKRIAEKAGGIYAGTNPSLAANALEYMQQIIKDHDITLPEDVEDVIKNGDTGILVYNL